MARLIVMPGDMDAAAMVAHRALCEEAASGDDDVVLDMRNVEFIDSSGVGAIVFMYKRLLGRGKTLKLQTLGGQPLQLLTYLRLTDLIER